MQGTLASTGVPQILQDLHSRRHSGVVHLSSGGVHKRVYFREGTLVFAASDAIDDRLGERLVRAGTLKRSELELACRVKESSKLRLGRTLVDMGYLTRDDLDASVREQVTSIIFSIFSWSSGEFRTELMKDPVDHDLERRDLSTANLLMEGVRRIENTETLLRYLGDVDEPLGFAVEPAELPDLRLTPEEAFVLSRVDGVMSPREIAQISPLGEDQTLRCVYALVAAGVLRVTLPATNDPTPVVPEKRETSGQPEKSEKPDPSRGPRQTGPKDAKRPEGVAPPAPPPPLKTPKAPLSSPTAPPSAAAVELLDRMKTKLERAKDGTLYELLDTEPSASPEAIKSAYFQLVKKLHPDHRTATKLLDSEGILDALYLKVTDAYEILSSEAERRRYDFGLQQQAERLARMQAIAAAEPKPAERVPKAEPNKEARPAKGFTTKETARIHYANGERFFADGRFHEAIEELRVAVRIDPSKADYHRLLGRALAKNPKWRRQAEEHFARALEINRFDAESYLALGEMYQEGGLETRARKMFEQALGVDPDNQRALEKLAEPDSGGTAFNRLKGILHRGRDH